MKKANLSPCQHALSFSLSLLWFICHLFFISSPFSKWLFLMPAGHELYKKNELYIHFVSLSSCLCYGHKIQPWGQEQFQILLICYHLTLTPAQLQRKVFQNAGVLVKKKLQSFEKVGLRLTLWNITLHHSVLLQNRSSKFSMGSIWTNIGFYKFPENNIWHSLVY